MTTENAPKLSRDDVNAFLDDKAPETLCPSCGSNDLAILADRDDGTVMTGFSLLVGGSFRFPVFVQVCRNCGFSFQFSVQRVLNWLKERDPQDD